MSDHEQETTMNGERESLTDSPTTAGSHREEAGSPTRYESERSLSSADHKNRETEERSRSVSVTYSDDGVDTLIKDHYESLIEQIDKLSSELSSTDLKNYTGMTRLNDLQKHVTSHMSYNEQFLAKMVMAFHKTNDALNRLNSTIMQKIEEESLDSWLDRPIKLQDVTEQAGSRELMLQAAQLRESLANTEQQLTSVTKVCADLELATLEAQQMSVQARQTAEEAARKAEVAEKAAKEKARLEEDKRQKAEALAKKQAEEEKAKKELEEKRRIEMEKIKGTPEEQERRNPNNWPSYTFKQTASNDFDGSYACIIRAMPGLLAQNDVAVEKINQLNSGLTLDNNDELVGNIVSINPVADNDGQAIFNSNELMSDSDEPLSILLPHCAPRSTSRELIVMWRQFQDADWVPLEAKECNLESVKEAKLVECRPRGLGVFAPIFRLKTDNHVITKKGGKFTSSVDGRLCVQCRPGSFRVNTPFTMQVQPVDLASVSDVKVRFPEECGGIISSSSIIKMEFPTPTLKRAINIITPIPANSARPKRPMTAVDKERAKPPTRPASAFGLGTYNKEEEEEDALHLLTLDSDGNWYITNQMEFSPQNKKGDLISVTTDIIPHKYWLLRTKASLSTSQVEAMADRLYDYIHRRLAQFIVRQKADDPTDIALVCVPSQKVDKTIRKLDEEGYTDCNKISQEIFVKEGQKLEVRFRGNLQPDEEVDLITSFNSQLKCQINLYIAEIDKYAQKTLSSYRGFAQFFTEEQRRQKRQKGMVTKDIYDESDKKKEKKPIGSEEVWDSIKLAELLISLPKPEQEAPKPLKKAKLNLIPEGPIDEALLKQLSSDLGDEWKMLASHLNVKKTRIQSIMRNHVNSESDGPIQEMLLTWIKRIPRSMDKVKVLCDALRAVGRLDLVEDVRDKEYDFNELRAELYKENLLRQIFVKIAQHHSGLARWKDIAQHLRVTDQELSNIEDEFSSGRERCLEALEIWKQNQGANASPQQLVRAVKYYRLNDLAGEIRRLINQ